MSKKELLELSKKELVNLIEAYTKLYLTLDGLWFLAIEGEYGHDVAVKFDVKVWDSLVTREAKRIREARQITGGGIEAIIEAFKYRPTFLTKEYNVTREKNKIRVQVKKCRSLNAMERDKREVSSCLRVLEDVYPRFAGSIDDSSKFRILKAPPRSSADDSCCEWEIEVP